jgi:hypothetical protein
LRKFLAWNAGFKAIPGCTHSNRNGTNTEAVIPYPNNSVDELVQRVQAMLDDPARRDDRRVCGTVQLMTGQLKRRPEVEPVQRELESVGYAAVPSWRATAPESPAR